MEPCYKQAFLGHKEDLLAPDYLRMMYMLNNMSVFTMSMPSHVARDLYSNIPVFYMQLIHQVPECLQRFLLDMRGHTYSTLISA